MNYTTNRRERPTKPLLKKESTSQPYYGRNSGVEEGATRCESVMKGL
jgi:hypothetical protein